MSRIDNMDLIVAARDLLKSRMAADTVIYDVVYPNKNLPKEFLLVKSLRQYDLGNVDVDGGVEVCVYVRNLGKNDDNSLPALQRINELSKAAYAILYDGQNKGVFFNSIRATLVKSSEIGYFYNSMVIETKSINLN